MEERIVILKGKVVCVSVFDGCTPGPNDDINQEKEFAEVVIRKDRPLVVVRGANKPPENYTRFVKEIIPDENGNFTINTLAASYHVKVH